MTGGTRWEWLRLHVSRAVSWPLWRISLLGQRAHAVHDRIIWWGERAAR